MKIRMITSMYGREGKYVRLLVDGKEIKRRVYYRSYCGLFVIVKGYAIFDYDFNDADEIEVGIKA